MFLEEYLPFFALIFFGNIENLILASQGVVAHNNKPEINLKVLALLSIAMVIIWLLIGTLATDMCMQYANVIEFIGGLAIFILGLQAMIQAVNNKRKGDQ